MLVNRLCWQVVLWLLVAATATASPLPRTGYASFLPGLTEYPAYGAPYPAYGAPYAGYEPPPPVRIVEQRQPPQRLPHPPAPLPDSAVAAPAAQSQVKRTRFYVDIRIIWRAPYGPKCSKISQSIVMFIIDR